MKRSSSSGSHDILNERDGDEKKKKKIEAKKNPRGGPDEIFVSGGPFGCSGNDFPGLLTGTRKKIQSHVM